LGQKIGKKLAVLSVLVHPTEMHHFQSRAGLIRSRIPVFPLKLGCKTLLYCSHQLKYDKLINGCMFDLAS